MGSPGASASSLSFMFPVWSRLDLPKPSVSGTEKRAFRPLVLYNHPSFPDGIRYSIKPPARQNVQTRSRHQGLCLHLSQSPGDMSSPPQSSRAQSTPLIPQGSRVSAGLQVSKHSARLQATATPPAFKRSHVYPRESLRVPSRDFVGSKYFLQAKMPKSLLFLSVSILT